MSEGRGREREREGRRGEGGERGGEGRRREEGRCPDPPSVMYICTPIITFCVGTFLPVWLDDLHHLCSLYLQHTSRKRDMYRCIHVRAEWKHSCTITLTIASSSVTVQSKPRVTAALE